MKFIYIANIRLPTEKAHGVQILKMCEAFSRAGNEVTLAVTDRKTSIVGEPFSYYGVQSVFAITRLPSWDLISFGALGFIVQSLTFTLSATAYLLKVRPGVVYTRDPFVVIVARLMSVPVVVWEAHTAQATLLSHAAGKMATQVVPISRGLASFLMARGLSAEKVFVEHDGVDLNEFDQLPDKAALRTQMSLPHDRKILEYVGKLKTMGHSKGVEEIIHMTGELKKTLPEVFLLVVGLNEDEVQDAEALASDAGLSKDEYRFVLHIPRADVPGYLRAGDVLIMNYPNTPHYAHIMSPLKLFEYMASGTTIVTSDLPSIREVLSEETAIFVTPDDDEALRKGVLRALTDTHGAERLSTNARKSAESHTWQARAERISDRMRSVSKGAL